MSRLTQPLVALLVLVLSCSPQDAASAFIQGTVRHLPCSTQYSQGRQVDDLSSYKQLPMLSSLAMSSLRVRGGGTAAAASVTKLSSTITDNHDEDDKSPEQAVRSIRYCCKMCVASVLADIFITFIDGDTWFKVFGPSASLSWVDYVGMFDDLSLLVFAGGMWRISHLYWFSHKETTKQIFRVREQLLKLFRTMSWIWGTVAVNFALLSVSIAAALPIHGNKGLLQFVFSNVSPSHLSSAVAGVLGIGGVVIQGRCEKRAIAAVRDYQEKHGNVGGETPSTVPDFDIISGSGYNAYCNQALAASSLAVVASLQLVKWIVSFNGDILDHLLSIWDVLTPFALSSLLFILNKAMGRAAVAAIMGNPTWGDVNDKDIYQDLFLAQARFYNKIADYLKSVTIFLLLPYITAPAIPYILRAVKLVSPSLYAKATEAGVAI